MRALVFCLSTGLVAVGLACVGSDPVATPIAPDSGAVAVGENGGKCFSDGQCKAGLRCVDGLVCLRPEETSDSGVADGALALGDATPDGPSSCQPTAPPLSTRLQCPSPGAYNTCSESQLCCVGGASTCTSDPGTCADGSLWACFATDQCPSTGYHCCAKGTLGPSADSCAQFKTTTSSCATGCSPSEFEVCSPDPNAKDCPPGTTCRVVSTSLGFGLGLCLP
ncbi:MAG: hypothetical protein KF764_21860 [Labilithrix sp.]|nr:hypothetical protein [Labilithrix sp.]